MDKIVQKQNRAPEILMLCKQVELHAPIRFRGKTEKNLYKDKHKNLITAMGWSANGQMVVIAGNEAHVLPSAAVADTILDL